MIVSASAVRRTTVPDRAMSVTLSLAYSVRKMTASNNLVRRMHACETIDQCIHSTFNIPTRAEAYKYAAYDGLQRLAATEASSGD